MIKRTIIDQIEVTRSGTIQIRFHKQILDGEEVLASENHRTAIEPCGNVDAQMNAVNAHLIGMGCAAVEDGEWERVRKIFDAVHGKERET